MGSILTNLFEKNSTAIIVMIIALCIICICLCTYYNVKTEGFTNMDEFKVPVSSGIIKSIRELTGVVYDSDDLKIYDFEALDKAELVCRKTRDPSSILPRDPYTEVACGWYQYNDRNKQSFAALGTVNGPLNPEIQRIAQGGKWYFSNFEEAQKIEDRKRCSKITACNLADLFPNQCAWCDKASGGIPVINNGRDIKYASEGDLDCQSDSRMSPGGKPIKDRLIGTVNMPKGDYTLTFDLTVLGIQGNWTNIMRVGTGTGDCCNFGERSPAIWLWPGDTRLHIRIGDQSDGNWGIDTAPLTIGKKTTFKLDTNGKQVTLTVDGRVTSVVQPTARATGAGLKVWMSDPIYEPANVTIENLAFVVDSKTVFGGPKLYAQTDKCENISNDICKLVNGNITSPCMIYLAKAIGMQESGMLLRILRNGDDYLKVDSGSYKNLITILNILRQEGNLQWNIEYFGNGSCARSDLIAYYSEVYNLLSFGGSKNVRDAAAWLVNGGGFDFDKCDSTVKASYDLDFLRRIFINNGGRSSGSAYPKEINLASFNNQPCSSIAKQFNKLCNESITSSDSKIQMDAIDKCIGIRLSPKSVQNVSFIQLGYGPDYINLSQLVGIDVTGRNVTRGRQASGPVGWGGVPSNAVDGGEAPRPYPQEYHSSAGNQVYEVKLDAPTEMASVTVYNRTDCCTARMSGHVVKFLDSNKNVLWTSPKLIDAPSQTVKVGG